MADLTFDKTSTALLVMDIQNEQYALVEKSGQAGDLLENVSRVIEAARRAGVPVIYVVVQYRPGYPEAHPQNRFQTYNKTQGRLQEGSEEAQIHESVTPRDDDIVVVKRRVNAFYGTELDLLLRSMNVDTIALAGIATRGVVLSTTRHAADADYAIIILEDCCADPDPKIHAFLMDKILSWQGTVLRSSDFVAALQP